MSSPGRQKKEDKKKGDPKNGDEEEETEEGRTKEATDKLRGPGTSEEVLSDVGTGKGKEFVQQTRASEDEKSGEYSMREGLDEESVALALLERKAITQHQLSLEMVKRLIQDRGCGGVTRILPALSKFLRAKGTEEVLIVSAGEIFGEMCEEKLWDKATIEGSVLPLALQMLKDVKQTYDVHIAWYPVVLNVLDILPYEKLRKDILNFTLEWASATKDSIRFACAKLTAPLFTRLQLEHAIDVPAEFSAKPKKDKMGLFDRSMAMCQDTDHRVRTVMAEQLHVIAGVVKAGGGDEAARKERLLSISEELLELLKDEEIEVRDASLGAAAVVMPLLEEKSAEQVLRGVKEEQYGKAAERPRDSELLARHLGPLMVGRGGPVDDGTWDFFFPHAERAPGSDDADARWACAFNLPGLLRAGGKARYAGLIAPVVEGLARDEEATVRAQVAKSLVGMAREFGPRDSAVHVVPVLLTLLRDEAPEVMVAVAAGLRELCPLIAPRGIPDSSCAEKTAGAICKFASSIQGRHTRWREELGAVEALGGAVGCFTGPVVQATVIPALLHSMASSPQVAIAAGTALMGFLRESRSAQLRIDTINRLGRDFLRSPLFSKRLLFCRLCAVAREHFSRQFFRIVFADAVLEAARDPVPMVRCRACALLPVLRRCLRLPTGDQTLLERVKTALDGMRQDKDRQVAAAVAAADEGMREAGLAAGDRDPESDDRLADEERVHGAPLDRKLSGMSLGAGLHSLGQMQKSTTTGKMHKASAGGIAGKVTAAKHAMTDKGSFGRASSFESAALRPARPGAGAAPAKPAAGTAPKAAPGALHHKPAAGAAGAAKPPVVSKVAAGVGKPPVKK